MAVKRDSGLCESNDNQMTWARQSTSTYRNPNKSHPWVTSVPIAFCLLCGLSGRLEFRKRDESKLLMECDVNCVIDGVLTIGEVKTADRLDKTRAAEAALIEKYRSLATSLGARRVVFATQAESWDSTTAQRILQVLGSVSLDVRLLTAAELLKP
jgi:hypothetical protein